MTWFVIFLCESIAVGATSQSVRTAFSDPEQITQALRRLDGKQRSQLVLEGRDDTVMIIGGGDGVFVATIAVRGDEVLFDLLRSPKDDTGGTQVELVTGGQLGSFDANQIIDEATVMRAALTFAENGDPDASLAWRRVC